MMFVACSNADFQGQNGTSEKSPEIVAANQNTDGVDLPARADGVDLPARSNVPHLPAAMVSLNYSRSFNYAKIGWSASYVQSAFMRLPANYQASQNYRDVMLPITHTHGSNAGVLKFNIPAKQNVFTIYYRDWANHLNKKEIKVARPS